MLQVVAAEATPAEVRQAAAVNFKNYVKRHWNGTGRDVRSLSDDGGIAAAPIPDAEKVSGHCSLQQPSCTSVSTHQCLAVERITKQAVQVVCRRIWRVQV